MSSVACGYGLTSYELHEVVTSQGIDPASTIRGEDDRLAKLVGLRDMHNRNQYRCQGQVLSGRARMPWQHDSPLLHGRVSWGIAWVTFMSMIAA